MLWRKASKAGSQSRDCLGCIVTTFVGHNGARYPWTLRDAMEGTQIIGSTGSGKSRYSGAAFAVGLLRAGLGGLVLTVKPDERFQWCEYARLAGRVEDLVVVDVSAKNTFNFLDYECRCATDAKLTHNLVNLFLTAASSGEEQQSLAEPFWRDSQEALLTNAFDLDILAYESCQLRQVIDIIRDAPQSRAEVRSTKWRRESACWRALSCAANNKLTAPRRADLEECAAYWLVEFAQLAQRTRSVIITSILSKATRLLRSPYRELFCSDGPSTATPDVSHRGKIVILDLPVKTFGETGRLAQLLYKTVWQQATERRAPQLDANSPTFDPSQRPVFLWVDEAQHFVTRHDMLFQQTARSAQAAAFFITQGISNYRAQLGSANGQAIAESLLGGFQTKVFHQSGDPTTIEWAERLFGRGRVFLNGRGVTSKDETVSRNTQESYLPLVPATTFTTLKKGGPQSNHMAEALVFQGGRIWDRVQGHVLRAVFQQPY